jgi:hypothetical protein
MKIAVLSALLVCCLASSAFAAGADLPAIVTDGLTAYQKDGSQAAIAVWLKNSLLERNDTERSRLEQLLGGFETSYGKMTGYEWIKTVVFSASSERIYLLVKLEKHPIYAAVDCYKTQEGWIIPILGFDPSPELLLPATVFEAR